MLCNEILKTRLPKVEQNKSGGHLFIFFCIIEPTKMKLFIKILSLSLTWTPQTTLSKPIFVRNTFYE